MTKFISTNTEDLQQIIELLEENNLPSSDISLKTQQFWKYQPNEKLQALAGIEAYGENAVFRSFVAHEDIRGTGIAYKLYIHLLQEAKKQGITKLFLLTTTAKDWFLKQKWTIIERNSVPIQIAKSEEFKSICPASATCMSITI